MPRGLRSAAVAGYDHFYRVRLAVARGLDPALQRHFQIGAVIYFFAFHTLALGQFRGARFRRGRQSVGWRASARARGVMIAYAGVGTLFEKMGAVGQLPLCCSGCGTAHRQHI